MKKGCKKEKEKKKKNKERKKKKREERGGGHGLRIKDVWMQVWVGERGVLLYYSFLN